MYHDHKIYECDHIRGIDQINYLRNKDSQVTFVLLDPKSPLRPN